MVATRVLIVDDHPMIRQGLKRLLAETEDFTVCGEAESVAAARESINAAQPELLIVDISLPDASGLELLKEVSVRTPPIPCLMLSMHREDLYAESALRAGARGYLMKDEKPEILLTALRRIKSGEVYVSQTLHARLSERLSKGRRLLASPIDALSDRELEIFQLIGQGRGTRQIADTLQLSVKTVESHRAHIKTKLHLTNAIELVQLAGQWQRNEKLT